MSFIVSNVIGISILFVANIVATSYITARLIDRRDRHSKRQFENEKELLDHIIEILQKEDLENKK